ncbi:MAG: SufD family Fe-S cluster assembly protein [Ilumatobacteraceae bacterium]
MSAGSRSRSPAATHIGHTRAEQGAGSQLRMTSITVGGDIARNAIDVHLDAADAHTELTGVNMTTGHQRHDTVVTVDHAASRCASSQRFAGVVDDHGRGSFSGEIIVRPGTVATDAHQSNRNLVLDPNAEADTRPWLKILADDVRCTHGATVGRLDDDALFYLRSRGIARAEARTMLIDAFIRDITDAIAAESVRAHVAALITATATGPASDRHAWRAHDPLGSRGAPSAAARPRPCPTANQMTLDAGGLVEVVQRLGGASPCAPRWAHCCGSTAPTPTRSASNRSIVDEGPTTGPFEIGHVIDALQSIYDPEIPVSIVELGLVYRCEEIVRPDGTRRIEIDMSMTAPGCGMGDVLRTDALRAVAGDPRCRRRRRHPGLGPAVEHRAHVRGCPPPTRGCSEAQVSRLDPRAPVVSHRPSRSQIATTPSLGRPASIAMEGRTYRCWRPEVSSIVAGGLVAAVTGPARMGPRVMGGSVPRARGRRRPDRRRRRSGTTRRHRRGRRIHAVECVFVERGLHDDRRRHADCRAPSRCRSAARCWWPRSGCRRSRSEDPAVSPDCCVWLYRVLLIVLLTSIPIGIALAVDATLTSGC